MSAACLVSSQPSAAYLRNAVLTKRVFGFHQKSFWTVLLSLPKPLYRFVERAT